MTLIMEVPKWRDIEFHRSTGFYKVPVSGADSFVVASVEKVDLDSGSIFDRR